MAVTDTTSQGGQASPSNVHNPPTEPFVPITSSAWWHRHLDPEERRRVMTELAITRVEHWAWRFTIMLTLSVVVAVMGLSANSAAIVIGAMLLAPLMQPVLAAAACLSMSLLRKSFSALAKVLLATLWCVAVAFVLSMILPDGALSSEIEARTRPDIRDLAVAIAAGAAGAYATVRKDASSSLPGVAVAVALVPPLATIGITLEAQKYDLAVGASLLYITNLAAIVFAGVMVFIATGFVPPRRLANTALQLLVAAVIAFTIVVIVAVPLFNRTRDAVDAAEDELTAEAIVTSWLGSVELDPSVNVGDGRVSVELRGFDAPPDDSSLRDQLRVALGDEFTVTVQWVRTERATTTITTIVVPSEEDALIARLEPIIDSWLAESDNGVDFERERVRLIDGTLVIDAAGAGGPPSVNALDDRIAAELDGQRLGVRLNWTERETITTEPEATPAQLISQRIQPLVDEWAERYALIITAADYDGSAVKIEAVGATEPPINRLVADLRAEIGDVDGGPVPIAVLFTEQRQLTTTIIVVDAFGGEGPTPTTTTTTGGPSPTSGG